MEEDIKILEHLKNDFIKLINKKDEYVIEKDKRKKEVQAIENLINKYKEQEKMIELMAEYIDFDKIELNCTSLCVKDGCRENCIIDYFRKKAR